MKLCRNRRHRAKRRPQFKHQIATKQQSSRIPIKRIAVQNAHESICAVLHECNIPYVNKTFGSNILRVCCRTIVQLDNIAVILKQLIKFKLIEEVGMPLTYNYKMKTLLVFLKPTSADAGVKLERVFQACAFGYYHQMIEVEYPSKTAKLVFEAVSINDDSSESTAEVVTISQSESPACIGYITILAITSTLILWKMLY